PACAPSPYTTLFRSLDRLTHTFLSDLPVGTFLANISGAFLLGLLVESLSRRGADHGRRRDLRLLLGTGLLGGYTTYSALANDTRSEEHTSELQSRFE